MGDSGRERALAVAMAKLPLKNLANSVRALLSVLLQMVLLSPLLQVSAFTAIATGGLPTAAGLLTIQALPLLLLRLLRILLFLLLLRMLLHLLTVGIAKHVLDPTKDGSI